jgi:hypothetical protein
MEEGNKSVEVVSTSALDINTVTRQTCVMAPHFSNF